MCSVRSVHSVCRVCTVLRGEGGDLISIGIGIGIRGRSIVFLPEYMGG